MDFSFSKEQLESEERARSFAEKEIQDNVTRLEEDLEFRLSLFKKMAKANLFSLSISTDAIGYALALKEIAKVDAGISVAMTVTNMVAETIKFFGNDLQQRQFLPKIGNGELVPAAFALTEKDAGSDAKSIRTEAKRDLKDSNYYILNGEKQFISNGDIAGVIIVMAKTCMEPSEITAFLVEKGTPGLSVTKKERKLGLLTANLVTLRFENCRIPMSNILGELGKGFSIAMKALDSGRIGIAAQSIGIAEAAFEAALKYSKERHQFGHSISENQAIAFKLSDMHVKLSAAKLLLFRACWLKDQKLPFVLEASEAKLYSSEMVNEIASDALQIYGGYGYVKDYPVEKYFRDARVTTLYEGTSEIQRLIISRHLLS